jgi:Flp pilus assembly protein TadB
MAQTKKKRHTKHRGNAAGMVEARGRTGRKPTADERKTSARGTAAERRQDRMFREPSWKGAAYRSAFAAVIFAVLVVLVFGQSIGQAIALMGFVFLLYVPLGYYTDTFLYKRKQKQLAAEKAERARRREA